MGKSTRKLIRTFNVPGYKDRYSVINIETGKSILITSSLNLAIHELYKNDDKTIIFPKNKLTKF